MPRAARLDAPGVLHHVMARGIDRQILFRDDADREDLLRRFSEQVENHELKIFAWALMSDHFHLLVETGARPLEHCMRSLLTGFATVFNRRHGRVGHLFQNRYKSIVCDVERYFVELVRYIHLNPVRAGIVEHFDDLDAYPYTGHSALLDVIPRTWQSTAPVLGRFSGRIAWARAAYRKFVADGAARGRRPELSGGGLVRSAGGWSVVKELRRGREQFSSDERILGDGRFVDRMLRDIQHRSAEAEAVGRPALAGLKGVVCAACGVTTVAIASGAQTRAVSKAREGLAYLWIEYFGQNGKELARDLNRKPSSLYKAAKRGRGESTRWIVLLRTLNSRSG